MVQVRQVGPDGWRAMRDVRLAALRDAPYAFGSTYAEEIALGVADWRRRITRGATFLAYVRELHAEAVGIAACFEAEPGTVELVSLWVDPRARGHGAGDALVKAVCDRAREKAAPRVHLWVTATNDSARRLYERCGFLPTGEGQPLPSDPKLTEMGMTRFA